MLKIERDKLFVAEVLILVISIDMINTSMLAPILPHIPTIVPFFGVVLLGLRFLYIEQYTFTFLLFACRDQLVLCCFDYPTFDDGSHSKLAVCSISSCGCRCPKTLLDLSTQLTLPLIVSISIWLFLIFLEKSIFF